MEKSLSMLIAKYVHKLNNLVGHTRAIVAIVQMEKADLLKQDPSLASMLQEIEQDAKNVLTLTDEFKLSFAVPDSGESVSVKVMLSHAVSGVEPPQSVNVTLEFDEGIPEVHATKNLVDVFRNLATNAFEAMPNGGKLQVSAKMNQVKERVEINFSDTGRGMPTYVVDSLFQPYFSTKSEVGHGLGLWWSKAYLESVGGDVELLWSEIGKGSSFLVSLPLSKGERAEVSKS